MPHIPHTLPPTLPPTHFLLTKNLKKILNVRQRGKSVSVSASVLVLAGCPSQSRCRRAIRVSQCESVSVSAGNPSQSVRVSLGVGGLSESVSASQSRCRRAIRVSKCVSLGAGWQSESVSKARHQTGSQSRRRLSVGVSM